VLLNVSPFTNWESVWIEVAMKPNVSYFSLMLPGIENRIVLYRSSCMSNVPYTAKDSLYSSLHWPGVVPPSPPSLFLPYSLKPRMFALYTPTPATNILPGIWMVTHSPLGEPAKSCSSLADSPVLLL
jgi:hypothetical protein